MQDAPDAGSLSSFIAVGLAASPPAQILGGVIDMAFGVYFRPSGFTPDVYDEAVRELEQVGAGFGSVPGRIFHCAMEEGGTILVFDVWESMEQFQKFGETLLPIMTKLGADPGEPQVTTIHNVQNG